MKERTPEEAKRDDVRRSFIISWLAQGFPALYCITASIGRKERDDVRRSSSFHGWLKCFPALYCITESIGRKRKNVKNK